MECKIASPLPCGARGAGSELALSLTRLDRGRPAVGGRRGAPRSASAGATASGRRHCHNGKHGQQFPRGAPGDHRFGSLVHGLDDLGVVDSAQVAGCDREIGVTELALDHNQRDPLPRHLNSVRVAQLIRRESATDAGCHGGVVQLCADARRRARVHGCNCLAGRLPEVASNPQRARSCPTPALLRPEASSRRRRLPCSAREDAIRQRPDSFRAASRLARASASVRGPPIPYVRKSAGLSSDGGQTPSLDGQDRVAATSPARPTARCADYLNGTVTGPGTLENTAMKSRSSGVR